MINEYVPSYLSDHTFGHDNLTFFHWYVATFSPWTYVELGVNKGDTLFAVVECLEEFEIASTVYGIDPWFSPDNPEYAEDERLAHEAVRDRLQSLDTRFCRIRILRMKSGDPEAVACIGEDIDLLFIDADHAYDSVKADFDTYLPLMSKSGVVALHDTCWENEISGPERLLSQLSTNYPVLNFRHGCGLGLVFMTGAYAKIPLVSQFMIEWALHVGTKEMSAP